MKKIFLAIILSLFIVPSTALAQGAQRGQGTLQQGEMVLAEDGTSGGSRGIGAAAQSLNRVSERNNNPEVGEQIRTMVQNHEQVQVRTKTALNQMSQRNQAVKLMIGPDYKNAGQVRSDVVGLRNDITKLESLKEDSLPADEGDIQGAIDELRVEADDLEVELEEQLSGVSLFGWLARLFAN